VCCVFLHSLFQRDDSNQVETKYYNYCAWHILYTHGLAEKEYRDLVSQPLDLILALYRDERILRKNEVNHCPGTVTPSRGTCLNSNCRHKPSRRSPRLSVRRRRQTDPLQPDQRLVKRQHVSPRRPQRVGPRRGLQRRRLPEEGRLRVLRRRRSNLAGQTAQDGPRGGRGGPNERPFQSTRSEGVHYDLRRGHHRRADRIDLRRVHVSRVR
jgi:hypothetical protein